MVSQLINNSNFSSAVNQVNKNSSPISNRNENEKDKRVADSTSTTSSSRVDEIKKALAEGSYKIDFRGSAEKMAQKLLGE